MTPWGRAMIGAACGAIVTLSLHPVSRPFLLAALMHFPAERCSAAAGFDRPLPSPDSPTAASEWLQVGAEKIEEGLPLSKGEVRTLIAIEDEAGRIQPDNAFWLQMRAVLLAYQGDTVDARKAWFRASNCLSWDDLQTTRLLHDRVRLVQTLGWDQAWTYGFVFFARSDAAAAQIQRFSQKLVSHTTLDDPTSLLQRYATVRNGSLLRDGSRSIKVGTHGWEMVELATYPPSLSGVSNHKRIWIAETNLTAKLRQGGYAEEARRAFEAFGNNDAWLALTGALPPGASGPALPGGNGVWRTLTEDQSPDDNLRVLCLAAVMLAGLPGAMTVGAVLAGMLLAAGTISAPRFEQLRFFPTILVSASALMAGGLVYWATRVGPAALCVGLMVQFLAVGPGTPRIRKSNDLGPLFGFTVFCIWLIGSCAFGLFLVAVSVPANAVGPNLGPSGEYLSNSPMFLAVTAIVLALTCLVAPFYAIVRRFGTPDLLSLSWRRLGTIGVVGCLMAAVVGWPLSVFADKIVSNELSQIVQNEPVYYLYVAQ